MQNKIEKITFVAVLVFLFGYFLQWLDMSFLDIHNEFTVLFGGLLCICLLIKQRKIRIDLETCLIAITLIIYFIKDLGVATAFKATYFYIAMVIYVLAHYIVCEIKKNNRHEEKFVLLITVMATAITIHGLLNAVVFFKVFFAGAYPRIWDDFWSGDVIYGTMQVAYFLPAFALIFPGIICFKKGKVGNLLIIFSTFAFLCVTVLSQTRMPILILPIIVFVQAVLYAVLEKEKVRKYINKKRLLIFGSVILIGLVVGWIVLNSTTVGKAFLGAMSRDGGIFNNIRFKVQRRALEQLFVYPMGGNMMDHLEQAHTHNAWLDMADIGGVIPFFAFVIYTGLTIYELIKLLLKKDVAVGTKVLFTGLFAAYFVFFTIEPSLDWSVHFMTPWLFLHGLIHGYVKEEKRGIKCFFP